MRYIDREPVVRFIDRKYNQITTGQYYISTIISHNKNAGLDLDGGVPEWKVDPESTARAIEICEYYKNNNISVTSNYIEPWEIEYDKKNFVLSKLQAAGIEVVTDKEQFDKILESQTILQKMTDDLSKLEELSEQLNKERSKTQKLEQTKDNQENSIRYNNYKDFIDFIEKSKEYIPVEKSFDTKRNYSTEWYRVKNRIPVEFSSDEASAWLVNAEISEGVISPVIIDRSYTGVRFLNNFDSVQQYFDDDHLLNNFKENINSLLEKQISLEREKQNNLVEDLDKQTKDIRKIEKRKAKHNIQEWATKENYDIAFLTPFSKITEIFGKETKAIGVLPSEIKQIYPSINDYNLYAQKDYFIDHWVNHHSELTESIFDELQNVLDNYDDIYFDPENNTIVFVKQQGRLNDFVAVEQKKNKLVFYDSTFLRKGIPSRFEKITPAREQELNVVEVRHTSSTAEQGLSDPAAGISTLNDNPNISQTENKSTPSNDDSISITQMKTETIKERIHVAYPSDIVPYLNEYGKSEVENFGVVILNGSHDVKEIRSISVGTVNNAIAHPREVFKESIRNNAAAVIVFHNHPSNVVEPSDEDIQTKKKLVEAANIIGIPVLDHIIISDSEYNYFSFKENNILPKITQNMTLPDGITYGFAHEGKIYLNPETWNSEAAVHEYTHLWDSYTQRTNPELWQRGIEIFENTKLWEEVKADPNYSDIADNNDLVLSEVHARICGKMADKVLERILQEEGQLTHDTIIDWDKETWAYIANEIGFESFDKVNPDLKITTEELKQFLSMPVKDLFINERRITMEQSSSLNLPDNMTEKDFDTLAYNIIQQAYENSGDGFNYIMDFKTVAGIAGKDVQWVKDNITNICDALYKYNDDFLLEFNEEEALAEENEINMCITIFQ